MNIGVLGTGIVGETLATALTENDHHVRMGSRTAKSEKAQAWTEKRGKSASHGAFNDAAAFADLVFVCLNGTHALEALRNVDADSLNHKIVVDVTNPLDFSYGMPPRIADNLGNHTSLGEEIQNLFPHAYVVKTLNTVNCKLMVDARAVNSGNHNLFICGNNVDAKNKVKHFLVDNFHWRADSFIDLGSIESARTMEAIVPFWAMLYQTLGTPMFNFKIVQ